jgi:predicted alpha-1,2-mannosidase
MPGGIMERAGYEHNTSIGGGLKYYLEMGYVPYPLPERNDAFHIQGAGLTLEYAYQDWTLAQFAKRLGHTDDYAYFMKRSQNYKNVYNPETGWMRPKNIEGKWFTPFDPYDYAKGFVEANGAQATWFVPHDLPGLAQLMGGAEAAKQKLEQQFMEAQKLGFTSGTSHEQETHPEFKRIPINYGNQPSTQTVNIFAMIGYPHLTQYWSRKLVDAAFSGLAPSTGYNGDEDQGMMGSLSVLLKTGLFQMTGGTDEKAQYQIGSPVFDKITIHLDNHYYPGKTFVIKANNNSATNVYIQKAFFNGKEWNSYQISHSELTGGGTLELEMSEAPNYKWGN